MKRQRVEQYPPPGYGGMPPLGGMGISPLPPHMMAQGVGGVPPLGPGGMGYPPQGPLVPQGFGAVPEEGGGVPFGFFPVVKLRGLPYGCTEEDIQQFLVTPDQSEDLDSFIMQHCLPAFHLRFEDFQTFNTMFSCCGCRHCHG